MSQEEGPIRALMEHLVAHLFKGQPTPDQSERALRAVSGQLGRNPPFVEDTRQFDDPSAEVVGSAISPKGEIAWVIVQNAANPLTKRLSLVTYSYDRGFSKPSSLGSVYTEKPSARVWFDIVSSNPVVLVNGTDLKWGIYTLTIPNPVDCLTVWCDHGMELHVWYVVDGEAFLRVLGRPIDKEAQHARLNAHGKTRWLGMVGDHLAQITFKQDPDGVRETLHWREIHATMPTWNEIIVPESIGILPGGRENFGLQFVAAHHDVSRAYWTNGAETQDGQISGSAILCYDRNRHGHGEILAIGGTVERFEKGRFVMSQPTDLLPHLGEQTRALRFGSTVVVSNFGLSAKVIRKRVCIVTDGHGSVAPNAEQDLALRRFHHGIATHRRDGTVHWSIPTAADIGTKYADFPIYGLPFDRLAEVEDDRGLAIMSWAFTDGTFHVLRYPLPSRPR